MFPNYKIKQFSTIVFDNKSSGFGSFVNQNLNNTGSITVNLTFEPTPQSSSDLALSGLTGEVELPLSISADNCSSPTATQTIKIPVQIPTERNIALSNNFSNTDSTSNWAVGNVTSALTTQNQMLYLWSNAFYKITASSLNGGVMKRTNGSTNAINELPYTLKFGDSSSPILTLDEAASPNTPVFSAQQGQTAVGGKSINVQLTTQDTGKRAGTYTDTVTVKIEAAP
jgi:hypothetical protein